MFTVYVLQDDSGKLRKGLTNNLKRRLWEHKSGKTRTTARMKNVKIIYSEEFEDKTEARKRELYFKTAAGRRYLKNALSTRGP